MDKRSSPTRQGYARDASDAEWALVAPYLTLLSEAAAPREHPLREVFGLRYLVHPGMPEHPRNPQIS